MSDKPEVITTEVEASDETVKTIRDAAPVGVSGAPIDRLPLNPQLQQMANSGIYVKRIASTDRCIRVVDVPLRGGATGQFHCSRACVRLGDMQLCPEHDKAAFAPIQTPVAKGRVINSASITLSAGEEAEMTKISKSFGVPPPAAAQPGIAVPAVPAERADIGGVESGRTYINTRIYLDELANRDVLAVIKERICESLDGLPCRNVRDMKQIVALQEKVAKLSKGGKRHARTSEGQAD